MILRRPKGPLGDSVAKEELNAFLGSNTVYEGKLVFEGSVHIDGKFTGEITSEGTLVIGKGAEVTDSVVFPGAVIGENARVPKAIIGENARIGSGAVVAPLGAIVVHGRAIRYAGMGPTIQKLYDTLTGIQMGRIAAPEGWIRVSE